MGRHEVGENGISYLDQKAQNAEKDIRAVVTRINRKCMKFVMHNGTHVGATVLVHAVAIGVLEKTPLHTVFVFLFA